MTEGGYKGLEVYRRAHELAVRVHHMSMKLPKFEMYELGSQVRRSSKRVPASIVEGHAMRKYKAQFLFYLYRALGSSDETQEHLETLHETQSLTDRKLFEELLRASKDVSRLLARFIQGVERHHSTPHSLEDDGPEPELDPDEEAARLLAGLRLESGIRNPESRKEPRNDKHR